MSVAKKTPLVRLRLRSVHQRRALAALGTVLGLGLLVGLGWAATSRGWDPEQPFMRDAPEVEHALAQLAAGDADAAADLLARYLETGSCTEEAKLQISTRVRTRPDATFDLGLALFQLGERYGKRFGDEETGSDPSQPGLPPSVGAAPGMPRSSTPPRAPHGAQPGAPHGAQPGGAPEDEAAVLPERTTNIACALVVVLAIAADRDGAPELRARAYFLAGNLEFLRKNYEEAVRHFDDALLLFPGVPEGAERDRIGSDVAFNRAIALRRLEKPEEPPKDDKDNKDEEKKDQEKKDQDDKDQEKKNQDDKDQEKKNQDDKDQEKKDEEKKNQDDKDQEKKDEEKKNQDDKKDEAAPDEAPKPPPEDDEDAPPPGTRKPSSRMLEELREAPTYQEENAKRDALRARRAQSMEDK